MAPHTERQRHICGNGPEYGLRQQVANGFALRVHPWKPLNQAQQQGDEKASPIPGSCLRYRWASFTNAIWGGTPQFAADARKALAFKQVTAVNGLLSVSAMRSVKRSPLLMLELFGITDRDPILAQLPHHRCTGAADGRG